jgi:hypothetical protein
MIFALAALALAIVISASYVLYDTDLWQHLAMGRAIWQVPGALHVNLWTWPDYGGSYFVSSWGFRALLWPLWSAGGVAALFAWRWLTTLAVFALLLATARTMGATGFSAILVMIWAAVGYRLRTDIRPETLAAVLFALDLWLLERHRARLAAGLEPGRGVWWIAAIGCAWANVHISYYLGFVLLAMYLADAYFKRRSGIRTLWLVTLATAAASLANPYGWTALRQPIDFALHWRNDPLMRTIAELQPLRWADAIRAGIPFWPLLLLWRMRRRGLDLVELLGCALFTWLALSSQRFLGNDLLLAAPFVARDLHELLAGARRTRLPVAARAIGFVAIGFAFGSVEWMRVALPLGLRIDTLAAPVAACDFMAAHGVRGRGFQETHFGGYLAWRFPRQRGRLPFISTQAEYSPPADRAGYLAALASAEGWRALDEARRFDYVLLERGQVGGDSLLDVLDREPGWRMVFSDDAAEVLVRVESPLRAVADSFAYRLIPAGRALREQLVAACGRDSALRSATKLELGRMIASSQRHGSASHLRGFLAIQDGDLSRARLDLEDAVALLPELTGAHDMLGTIAYRQGRWADAVREYQAELRSRSAPPGIYFRLGATWTRLGDLGRARALYRRELARDPEHQSARDSLAALEGR